MPTHRKATPLLFAAAAVLAAGTARADALGDVKAAGALRWGADQEGGGPYVYPRDDAPTEVTGFEVELAALMGQELGVRPVFTQAAWDKLPDMLLSRRIDVVLNGYELTPEHAASMQPSMPYYVYELALLARKDDGRIAGFDTLRTSRSDKLAIGTLTGSAADRYTRELCEKSGACEVRSYDGSTDAMREVETKKLDATVQDTPVAAFYGSRFPGLHVAGKPEKPGYYVAYVPKGDVQLARVLDAAIAKAALSGQLERIYRSYGIWNDAQGELVDIARASRFFGVHAGAAADVPAAPPASSSATPSHAPPPAEPEHALGARKHGLEVVKAYGGVLLESAGLTVVLAALSFPIAVVLGLLVALGRLYGPPWLKAPLAAYVEFLRGTPVMLQLYFVFFVLPEIGLDVPALAAGVLGLAINYSAYESEIYRAGLQAVPAGQMEAAMALGMSRLLALRRVVVPQAVRMVVPPVVNDFIALFKDTSVCSVITLVELTKRFSVLSQSTQATLELMAMTATLYLVMSYPLSLASRSLERRLGAEQRA